MPRVTDAIKLAAKRSYTSEGYLVAPAIIATSGVLQYYARELELKDRAPSALVKVFRSADELTKAAPSFEYKPITLDHPLDGVDAATWKTVAVGEVHNVSTQDAAMHATMIVRDKAAIDAINKGKRELSNGYTFDLRATRGEEYEFEQINIQGNHIAIVDRARCGPSCIVGDRDPITHMEDKKMIRVAMDGYPAEVDEATAGVIIQKLQGDLKAAKEQAALPAKVKVGDKMLDAAEVNGVINELTVANQKLKDEAPTPEKFKQEYAAEMKMRVMVKDMCPTLENVDDQEFGALCTAALHKLEENAALKTQLAAVLDGLSVDKATIGDRTRAIRTMHAATAADRERKKQDTLGREIFAPPASAVKTADGRSLDGRDAYIYRLEHMMDRKVDPNADSLED